MTSQLTLLHVYGDAEKTENDNTDGNCHITWTMRQRSVSHVCVQLTTAAQYRTDTRQHFLRLCWWTYQQGSCSELRPYATTCRDDAASANDHCLSNEALLIAPLPHKRQMWRCWNDRRQYTIYSKYFFLQIHFCGSLTIKIKILVNTIVTHLIKNFSFILQKTEFHCLFS